MTRLFNRRAVSQKLGGSPSVPTVQFDSTGTAEVTLTAAQVAAVLREYGEVVDLGLPGVHHLEGVAGNATTTITVPSGKYWRLLSVKHVLVTDGTVANRAVVYTTQDTVDASVEAITHANVAASTTAKRTTLYGIDDYVVGNEGVAAQGTLTLDTQPTEDDTMVLNGVTFTWKDALTGAANELFTGADVAASQAALEAAFLDRDNGGTLHSVTDAVFASIEMTMAAFAANDAVFTANVKGTAGNSLATTETYTAGTNVFDAATLGTTTAGVDAADQLSTLDYPDVGVILPPGYDLAVSVTNGVAGDALDFTVSYLELDADPR